MFKIALPIPKAASLHDPLTLRPERALLLNVQRHPRQWLPKKKSLLELQYPSHFKTMKRLTLVTLVDARNDFYGGKRHTMIWRRERLLVESFKNRKGDN